MLICRKMNRRRMWSEMFSLLILLWRPPTLTRIHTHSSASFSSLRLRAGNLRLFGWRRTSTRGPITFCADAGLVGGNSSPPVRGSSSSCISNINTKCTWGRGARTSGRRNPSGITGSRGTAAATTFTTHLIWNICADRCRVRWKSGSKPLKNNYWFQPFWREAA